MMDKNVGKGNSEDLLPTYTIYGACVRGRNSASPTVVLVPTFKT